MHEPLKEEEIEFMEAWYDPIALSECLFPKNHKSPQKWCESPNFECVKTRNYQFVMHDFSSLYADDPKLDPRKNYDIKRVSGTCYNIAARDLGKSFWLWIDVFCYLVRERVGESMLAAPNNEKLKKICDPLLNMCREHPFFEIFKKQGKVDGIKAQPVEISTFAGHTLYGRNENVDDIERAGEAFHSVHAKKRWYEEFCVDGKTQIHYALKDGTTHCTTIDRIINYGIYKDALFYSYNFDKKQIELKPVTNTFKKQVKKADYYTLTFEDFGNRSTRYLKASRNQPIWTQDGYKKVEDLKIGDLFYTQNYTKFTEIQKQALIGTLLGDACITRKNRNCNFSLVFVHGKIQEDYLKYKKDCFLNLFKSFRRDLSNIIKYQKTSYGGNVGRLCSDTCVALEEFSTIKKPNLNIELINKYISPISLAFWLMDDGQLQSNKGKTKKTKVLKFNTQGFKKEDQIKLIGVLKNKFGIEFQLVEENRFNKKYFSLKLDNKNSLKFIELVKDYIHPTLYYKIYNNCELCDLIYKKEIPNFIRLDENLEFLLQEVKLLDIKRETKTWTMYDVEIKDNHNFFANGILISNSYATKKGQEKGIDSEDSLGCIDRLSGIPDLRAGSPLGDLLKDKSKRTFICRLPQFVRPDWSDSVREIKAKKHKGKYSPSFRLNVEGEILEGAFSKWDMDRIRKNCLKTDKHIKFFEINKEIFQGIEDFQENKESEKELLERLGNSLPIVKLPSVKKVIASDIGTTGSPSEVGIFFGNKNSDFVYEYQISLFKMTSKEQAFIFNWLYRVLDGAFICVDNSNADGQDIVERLVKEYKVPRENISDYNAKSNTNVGWKLDENGKVLKDDKGKPLELEVYTKKWAVQQLETIFYDGKVDIPYDEKFLDQFANHFEKPGSSGRPTWGSSTDEHLVDMFLCFAFCVWDKCWRDTQKLAKNERPIGYI